MKTRMQALLVATGGAIAAALIASSFTLGGAYAVQAQPPEAPAAARPDMVVISAAALDGLDQRISYLEGVVASLALSSQHVTTYQLCVTGEGGAQTCLTQPELALLTDQVRLGEAAQRTGQAGASPEIWKTEPETTGSIPTVTVPAGDE